MGIWPGAAAIHRPAIPSRPSAGSFSAGLTGRPKTEARQIHIETLAGGEQDAEEPIER